MEVAAGSSLTVAASDLYEDSNAVESPKLWLIALAAKVLGSPLGVWLGVAISVGLATHVITFQQTMTQLIWFGDGCLTIAFSLFSLPLFSLRRVTREGGQLQTLGAGNTKISAKAATRLGRWHIGLLVFSALWVLFGLFYVVNALLGNEDVITGFPTALAMLAGLFVAYVVPLASWAWWLSLKVASALVSDEVTECRKLIDTTSATSAEWDIEVVPQLLQLVNSTLPALSRGWANGLLALWTACWAASLGMFTHYLDCGTMFFFVMGVISACVPLFLAADVASASSDCDTIKAELNSKRAADLSVENDAKLFVLERLLQNLNKDQGLGFVVGGTVLDNTTLKMIFAKMAGLLGTVGPIILSLAPTTTASADAGDLPQCAATAAEIAHVRATFTNSSCSYTNLTVGSLLN
jgi:hypothetical protein